MNMYARVIVVTLLLCSPVCIVVCATERECDDDASVASWFGTPQHQLFQGIWDNNLAGIRKALKDGANLHEPLGSGNAPLLAACFQEGIAEEILIFLIERGADVHAVDYHGRTPLYAACMYGRDDLVRQLLPYNVAITAAAFDRAKSHEAVRTVLQGHVDMLVIVAQSGDTLALEQCQRLAAECQGMIDEFQKKIAERAKTIAEEQRLYATYGHCCRDDKEQEMLMKLRHRGLLMSCAENIAEYQHSIVLLAGCKTQCERASLE